MKLNVHEIDEVAKELEYEEATEALNDLLVHGDVCDFDFPMPARVRLQYYRAGQELFFTGTLSGEVVGHCARCLAEYVFPLENQFSIVMVPHSDMADESETSEDELDLAYYSGDEIDLGPIVREHIILALPTRPLCRETCKGLCAQCGADLNTEACDCTASSGDPRLAVLRNLKIGH